MSRLLTITIKVAAERRSQQGYMKAVESNPPPFSLTPPLDLVEFIKNHKQLELMLRNLTEQKVIMNTTLETPEVLDIAIIGAGPCALAVAARMRETTPSALFTDAEHQRYHWIKRHKHRVKLVPTKGRATNKIIVEDKSEKPCGPICEPPKYLMAVYDSSGPDWMTKWTCLFRAYNIKTLRSPLFFHVDPRDRDGLKAYAYAKGREKEMVELKGVVGKEISKHLMKKKLKRGPSVNAHT